MSYAFNKLIRYYNNVMAFPKAIVPLVLDKYYYYRTEQFKEWDEWGFHVYVGGTGASKTSSMVWQAYKWALKYPQLQIWSNFKLYNFPAHTRVHYWKNTIELAGAPPNTLILMDECGTLMNCREHGKGKSAEVLPKPVYQMLCQVRHLNIVILTTAQWYEQLDAQLRKMCDTVMYCRIFFRHPFSRISTVTSYDGREYRLYTENPMIGITPLKTSSFVQTEKLRAMYDTKELIDNLINADYVDDSEILASTAINTATEAVTDKKSKRMFNKWRKRG